MTSKQPDPEHDLPSRAELAVIAATIRTPRDLNRRMEQAFALWKAAGEFLRLEPVRIKNRRERSAKEIERSNAEVDHLVKEAAENARDPFGLNAVASKGFIRAADFLPIVLPDGDTRKDRADVAVNKGEDDDNLPAWTDALRSRVLGWFLCGNVAVYPPAGEVDLDKWASIDPDDMSDEDLAALGLQDPSEWRPRFKDGAELLKQFTGKGLPMKRVLGFAGEFHSFAEGQRPGIKRDLAMIAVKARKKPKTCPACGHKLKDVKCDCALK